MEDNKTVSEIFGVKPPKVMKSKLPAVACANPSLICGVELEIEAIQMGSDQIQSQISKLIWGLERDGSLRPQETSWEFISKPLQLEFLLAELNEFFRVIKLGDANYSDRTSIHIHTNVTDFTQTQLATLALIYPVVESIMFEYVNKYNAKSNYGYCRDTNIYCIPWSQCRMNHEIIRNLFNDPKGTAKKWQKYTALNLLPITEHGTVEWRHMHGTNDMEKLTTWLNLIGSVMSFAKQVDFDDAVKTIQTLNDSSAYQQFFHAVLQHYLPYEDAYARSMSEGVINAKYALMNRSKKNLTDLLRAQVQEAQLNIEGFIAEDFLDDEEDGHQAGYAPVQAAPVDGGAGMLQQANPQRVNAWQWDPPAADHVWPPAERRVFQGGAVNNQQQIMRVQEELRQFAERLVRPRNERNPV